MSDREKIKRIYEAIDKYRDWDYEDLTKYKLYKLKEEIYDILIGRNRNEETIFVGNKSRYTQTIL